MSENMKDHEKTFEEKWNELTVAINRVGIDRATEILREFYVQEVPEAIKDLLYTKYDTSPPPQRHNNLVIEAYNRGLKDSSEHRVSPDRTDSAVPPVTSTADGLPKILRRSRN